MWWIYRNSNLIFKGIFIVTCGWTDLKFFPHIPSRLTGKARYRLMICGPLPSTRGSVGYRVPRARTPRGSLAAAQCSAWHHYGCFWPLLLPHSLRCCFYILINVSFIHYTRLCLYHSKYILGIKTINLIHRVNPKPSNLSFL